MISKDNQPLSSAENKGFINLMNVVSPSFKIPSRRDISRRLEGKYELFISIFKDKLKKVQYISLTTEIWTDIHTQSYLGITIHFEENSRLTSGLLGVIDLQERHTSQYIATKLKEVCEHWEILSENITAVVTDGAPSITKAVDLFFSSPLNKRHIPCFAHTLNLVAQSAIASIPDLILLVNKVKSIKPLHGLNIQ